MSEKPKFNVDNAYAIKTPADSVRLFFAEFIECVASHYRRYHGSDRVFAPYDQQGISAIHLTLFSKRLKSCQPIGEQLCALFIARTYGTLKCGLRLAVEVLRSNSYSYALSTSPVASSGVVIIVTIASSKDSRR